MHTSSLCISRFLLTMFVLICSVATGLGLPSTTRYECLIEPKLVTDPYLTLIEPLASRLRIEIFCDRVTEALYDSPSYKKTTGNINERSGRFNLLNQELLQLESDLNPEMGSSKPTAKPLHPTVCTNARSGNIVVFSLCPDSPATIRTP